MSTSVTQKRADRGEASRDKSPRPSAVLTAMLDELGSFFTKSKELIPKIYTRAREEGFSPEEARTLITERVDLTDTQIRKYLPEEAKDMSKVPERTRRLQEEKKRREAEVEQEPEEDTEKGEMTVKEAGQKGIEAVREQYGEDAPKEFGKKGGEVVREAVVEYKGKVSKQVEDLTEQDANHIVIEVAGIIKSKITPVDKVAEIVKCLRRYELISTPTAG